MSTGESYSLSVMRRLEAESIHIMREVVAEFERPVMLYSIGKDSSVHGAPGAEGVLPGENPLPAAARRHHVQVPGDDRVPRPVLPRDRRRAARLHATRRPSPAGANPFELGTEKCCALLKTQALLDALRTAASTRHSAARAATRRNRAPRSASTRSATSSASGTRRTSARSSGTSTTAGSTGREHPRLPALQLDRARRLALHRTWRTSPSCRSTSPRARGGASAGSR